jgi:hypothetical protein
VSARFALILIVLDIRSYYMLTFSPHVKRGNDEQSFIHKT